MNGDSPEALGALVQDIGDAGIAHMADTPGLAAAVDQHVASLREELGAAGRQELLRYLHRFAEDAVNRGWWPENVRDWEFVRIVAVCWMMRHSS
ncbi:MULTISPECIES: DUF6401 family natural product biosynthesis protein [Actinomadura]|uniref:Type VI protein secretion system component VasF n=1 Tax=Actinomadura livida TaxID=79909 RepID=A0A7W7I7P8_9ACTN|nr:MULTISPECIES: DUF6401 family natural product biosynthesis protein [Actinomadura]MBB4771975.1 type VI protein secretion system component VasF [Actinomadura catellatispora]TDB94993.1 hypothetical protein E1266_14800 [Actinomadura sp. 7K534]GGU03795.1 hypothetical protein GCM10010208_29990 [Actinomadura livida]